MYIYNRRQTQHPKPIIPFGGKLHLLLPPQQKRGKKKKKNMFK